ncbi:tetratricopeptide repeat protein [Geitlerinema sp. P-1104]|uniref:tetratricopeptide repeat protein n=1 Tax=Geitlerinema sp. P-1104 TaxID=2546230 RepID=UPI0014774283|nr:tetratricopeptide repeat protein [Geitlerinema sp. P-1104]NMG59634.1 tetratricopeptide repeat protein [Geitlerinema sp. P-1104]
MPSLEDAIAAIETGDYRTASRHLKVLYRTMPENPWVKFYIARLYEESQRLDEAETAYRVLLRNSASPKIISHARQGLKRLDDKRKLKREQAIAQAKAKADPSESGVLILEATPKEQRQQSAQHLARIFDMEAYAARLMLQVRGWRLYRTGPLAELEVYEQELQAANIAAFSASLTAIDQLNVWRVDYVKSLTPKPVVICRDRDNRQGQFSFEWREVRQQIRGGIPWFINAVSYDISRRTKDQIKRKPETQDFVQMCDLHLPKRGVILRFCDRSYEFDQGVVFAPEQQQQIGKLRAATLRINWNGLLKVFDHHLAEILLWSDFSQFAETAINFHFLMEGIDPYVDIERPEASHWDPAFQLYSGAAWMRYLKSTQRPS